MIGADPIDASAPIAHLDAAGIERAAVLSVAYTFGSPNRAVEHEYDQVETTNDWTSEQVRRFPDQLRGCCGLNPLRGYALEELALIARRIRELGVDRVLYGSDAAVPGNRPREGWASFRTLPLSEAEFRAIAGNVAPYMR